MLEGQAIFCVFNFNQGSEFLTNDRVHVDHRVEWRQALVRDSVGQLKLVTPLEALKLFSEQLIVVKDLDCQVLGTLNS
jgi:hypothetical protein